MSDLRQAAEMALKALENMSPDTDTLVEVEPHVWEYRGSLVIQALRQALAEPEDPRIVELRTLMAEPTVTGVIFEVHRGPLSKSIREYGDCPCPTQEPVGYAHVEDLKREHHDFWVNREQGVNEVPLYTAPPQKEEGCAQCGKQASQGWALYCVECAGGQEWVGLTDEDLSVCDEDGVLLARYWEAKLKAKNESA